MVANLETLNIYHKIKASLQCGHQFKPSKTTQPRTNVFVVVVAKFVQRFDFEVLYTAPEAN